MKFHLIVAQDFSVYSKGQRIHDPAEVQRLSDGPDHVNVTKIVVSDGEHDAYLEELNRIAEEQRKLDEESARQHAPPVAAQEVEQPQPEAAPEPELEHAVEEPLPADDGAGGMRVGGAPRPPARRRDHPHRGE